WQGALGTAREGVSPEVATAVGSVATKAFVTPESAGLTEAQAAEMRKLTSEASADAFRNGMLLAAALVATGGLVSVVGSRRRGDDDTAEAIGGQRS
ncbi:MAG TPA: hypothetical protein VLA05_09990, partial [Coriobacteriia bacterium]|nr:hypothetical protein [Coriobacteriia bacterium]